MGEAFQLSTDSAQNARFNPTGGGGYKHAVWFTLPIMHYRESLAFFAARVSFELNVKAEGGQRRWGTIMAHFMATVACGGAINGHDAPCLLGNGLQSFLRFVCA